VVGLALVGLIATFMRDGAASLAIRTILAAAGLLMLGAVGGCVTTSSSAPPVSTGLQSPSPTENPSASYGPSALGRQSPTASRSAAACTPGDQDVDVYHPARLVVIKACIRVTGTVYSSKTEADGDLHIRLTVDPSFAGLINDVNRSGQLGKLLVEPVCERPATQADAIASCAADADPVLIAGLSVGTHVWMEGRYVTDSQHGGWAELHPLYRWGLEP
jgi:hypothetical protein